MPLFVVLRPGAVLDDALKQRINDKIRRALSARYVPSEILAIPEVPRTLSGKKLELPIKRLLLGHPLERVAHADAMANPASLGWFMESARGGGDRGRKGLDWQPPTTCGPAHMEMEAEPFAANHGTAPCYMRAR